MTNPPMNPAIEKAMKLMNTQRSVAGMKNSELKVVQCSDIVSSRYQPRSTISLRSSLPSLIAQIKEDPNGIVQPPTVFPLSNGKYELICGERRLRAWMAIGHTQILVNVTNTPIDDIPYVALVENTQRHDLTCGELSRAIQKIKSDLQCTDADVHRKTGISKAQLSRYSSICKLMDSHPSIDHALTSGYFELPLLKVSDALHIYTNLSSERQSSLYKGLEDTLNQINQALYDPLSDQKHDSDSLTTKTYDFHGYLLSIATDSHSQSTANQPIADHGNSHSHESNPSQHSPGQQTVPVTRVRGPAAIIHQGADWVISRRASGDAIKIKRQLTPEQIQQLELLINSFK